MGAVSPDYKPATLAVGEARIAGFAALYEVFDVRDARGEHTGTFETDQLFMSELPTRARIEFTDGHAIDVVLVSMDASFGSVATRSRLKFVGAENMSGVG